MPQKQVTVLELAPAADELWVLQQSSQTGYVDHRAGVALLPDVGRGAKLRPTVTAAYAGGKATNVARVLEAVLSAGPESALAEQARARVAARLLTFLPGQAGEYHHPSLPGEPLARFTPGGAYLACLQARDFRRVALDFVPLPPAEGSQRDRRCINLVARDGGELANFSPYLDWQQPAAEAVLQYLRGEPLADVIVLAGSLPMVEAVAEPGLYAQIIATIKARRPGALVSLDVGGAALRACLEREGASPDLVCINLSEYAGLPQELWERFSGVVAVHDKRGCWVLQGRAPSPAQLSATPPDVPVPAEVQVTHTICAGDAAHGGFVLGAMLYGTDAPGLRKAALLSQACALTIVESPHSIRGLTADRILRNMARLAAPR